MHQSLKRTKIIGLMGMFMALYLVVGCASTPWSGFGKTKVDPLRFADVVNGYKSADSLEMPLPNSILFVGSSSIHGWKSLPEAFPEVNAINRGMGGSHMSDLIYYMDDIVFPYSPNAIVVYEGDNDIASGKTPERVLKDYQKFVSKVRQEWPELPVFFLSIKPSLARIDVMGKMAAANALIRAHIESQANQYYIDVFTPMLGEDGKPRPDIFGHDGLHMNELGYAVWAREIRKELGID